MPADQVPRSSEPRPPTALVAVTRRRPITAGRTAYHLAVASIVAGGLATALSWSVVEDAAGIAAAGCLLVGSVAGLRARRRTRRPTRSRR